MRLLAVTLLPLVLTGSVACSGPVCANETSCPGPNASPDATPAETTPSCTDAPNGSVACAVGGTCRASPLRCEETTATAGATACGKISCEAPCGCLDAVKSVCDCRIVR